MSRRALLALGLLVALVTCRDGSGPQIQYARVAVAPVLPSDAGLASFGLSIDRVRIVVVRPIERPDTLADTTINLPPEAQALDLNLRVPIVSSPETVLVSIIALAGSVPLFEGTAPVEVSSGVVSKPTEIPIATYVGPGAGVDSIVITPRSPFLYFGDSLRFQVQAFQAGTPVPDFYVSWSTSDTGLAHINGIGSVRAPLSRRNVWVIARTPGAIADSVTATFQPVPSQLAVISGGGQTGPISLPLATQLEVEVRGADNLPVFGVAVRFRSLSGGTPNDTTVTSDLAGRARVIGVLGPLPGAQSFVATLPAFSGVTAATFNATATGVAISPATSIVTVASGSVLSGNTVKLRLQAKDAGGSDITTGGATVVFTRAGGTSTGTISATADSGNGVYTAVFTGVLAGAATTIGATINGSAVTSTAPTITVSPGAISSSASPVTISNGTVTSGAVVILHLRGRDAAGNNVTTGGAIVVFSSSGGTSTGTISATADSGTGGYTATFTGELAGTGTSIGASIDGTPVTTPKPSLVVIPGAPAQLVFAAAPGAVLTGVVFSSAVQVSAKDLAGNATPAFAGDVTIAIGTNPGSGSLAGTLTRTASSGIATFNDLAIDLPGIGYTLSATSPGLARDTTASFDVVAPGGTIFWAAPTSGNWSNPANWVGGVVPGSAETAAITVPGTYTVTLDVGDTIAGMQLGASSGTQTLLSAGHTLHVSGTTQVNANGLLWLKASTLDGGTLANGGKVFVEGATSVTTGITTSAGSLIRLQGNSAYSTAVLTVASAFTNNGGIVLTDSNSSYGATLNVTSGALTNAPSATIDVLVGTGGPRTLGVQLGNQGTLTVNQDLALARVSAQHSNSGAISLAGGNLTISQSGTLPSFATSGSITMGASDSLKLSSGTVSYVSGSINGGTLSLSSTAVTATQSFSTATAGLSLASSTWGGTGTLTIASGTTIFWRASAINAPLVNQGTLVVNGASAFNGAVTNASGATLRPEGNSSYSTANLTVANSFTNSGAIVLTDINSSYGATITMPAGAALTNAAGATIQSAVGTLGPRTLALELNNQGTLTLNRSLTLARASAAHTNSGTIDLVSGNLSINQSGTAPSFTNTGSMTIATGDSVKVSSGALNLNGGTISGGTLSLTSTAVTAAQDFSTATAALSLASSTWGGAGTLTIAPSTTVFWRASAINAPLVNQGTLVVNGASTFNGSVTNVSGATLQPEGNSSYSTAVLTVANSFTNNGAIVLTDINSSYGATITMPAGGTLTNAPGATIDAAVGTLGPRTLAVELNNQGTLTLNRGLTLGRASAAHLNSGAIDLAGGDLTINQSGTTPSFTNTGAINIGSGDSVKVSSGAFNYTSGTISGAGTFAVTSVNVTASQNFSTATAALSLASSTWGGSGTLTVASGTSLLVRASTINSALLNQGLLVVNGASAFNGSVTNPAGATLRVQGNGIYGVGSLSIATAFTNAGTIELTDTTSSYGATLSVSLTQPFINAAGGTIAALQGFNGHRFIFAQLDNQGTVSVATAPNQPLTFAAGGVSHQNSGTIVITSGNLLISGPGESFTNTGAISIGAGDTLRMTNGSFTHNGGTLGGAGALSLESVTTGAFNVAQSIASMLLTNSTASFATPQSTGATGFQFSSSTINGPGLLTNDLGRFLNVRSSTINTDLDNHGTLLVNGSSAFNGVVTTGDTSLIQVQGNGTYSTGTMTVLNGFTNRGVIELSDIVSSYGATLNVTNGTLTNASGASINALAGTNGARTLGATLDNQGSLSVALAPTGSLTLNHGGADHQNTGTIDVSGGDFVITQSGTTPSFSNAGAITVGSGDTLRINGGAFTHASGTAGGAGTLVLFNVNPASFTADQTFGTMTVTSSTVAFTTPQSTTATGFDFTGSFVDGPGPMTNEAGNTLPLHSTVVRTALRNFGTILTTGATSFTDTLTTVAGSLIRIQGNGTYGSANLTVTKGFENAGTVELTDTTSTYGSTLTVPNGKLLNLSSGLISAAPGANGSRTLTAAVDNQGALAVALQPGRDLLINQAGAVHTNSGTIDITSGDLAITSAASFQNVGAINIGGGDTLSITNGAFSYDAGTLGVGTLVLSSVNPANFSKPHNLGSIVLNNSAANFAADDSTATTGFLLTSSSIAGTGTLFNSPGNTLNIRGNSSIGLPFVNQGTLLVNGSSSIDGPLTTVAGSLLRVQGNSQNGAATLTVSNGLVNNGAIELTDSVSTYGATLVVKTLPLVNAGTIDILPGANGARTIDAVLDNQGTFTGNQSVTINHPSSAHTNRGTFKVKAGAITFAQSGGNPSFTNQAGGLIDIDAGTVFRVTAGPVTNALGGKIAGFGTLDVRPPATFSHDGEILPGASPGKLTIAGNMQIPTSGIITIELGGPTAGTDYDQLAITGAAIFAEGTLNVVLLPTLPDPKGLSFDVMTFGPGSTTGLPRNFTVPTGCNQPVNTGTSIRVVCP
jgi:fibronectin-binding autotransporter adhesin